MSDGGHGHVLWTLSPLHPSVMAEKENRPIFNALNSCWLSAISLVFVPNGSYVVLEIKWSQENKPLYLTLSFPSPSPSLPLSPSLSHPEMSTVFGQSVFGYICQVEDTKSRLHPARQRAHFSQSVAVSFPTGSWILSLKPSLM